MFISLEVLFLRLTSAAIVSDFSSKLFLRSRINSLRAASHDLSSRQAPHRRDLAIDFSLRPSECSAMLLAMRNLVLALIYVVSLIFHPQIRAWDRARAKTAKVKAYAPQLLFATTLIASFGVSSSSFHDSTNTTSIFDHIAECCSVMFCSMNGRFNQFKLVVGDSMVPFGKGRVRESIEVLLTQMLLLPRSLAGIRTFQDIRSAITWSSPYSGESANCRAPIGGCCTRINYGTSSHWSFSLSSKFVVPPFHVFHSCSSVTLTIFVIIKI